MDVTWTALDANWDDPDVVLQIEEMVFDGLVSLREGCRGLDFELGNSVMKFEFCNVLFLLQHVPYDIEVEVWANRNAITNGVDSAREIGRYGNVFTWKQRECGVKRGSLSCVKAGKTKCWLKQGKQSVG